MEGSIDANGRAIVNVHIRSDPKSPTQEIAVWVDTGFTGAVMLPRPTIEALALGQSGTVDAILADGSQIEMDTYSCIIDWFGQQRRLEVVANEGDYPLLGVGLLLGRDLHVSYRSGRMTID